MVPERDSEDVLEAVDARLKRVRSCAASLLEVENDIPEPVLDMLLENFEAEPEVVVPLLVANRFRGLDGARSAGSSRAQGFTDRHADALAPRGSRDVPGDEGSRLLLHHPFDSFTAVETFLEAAAKDPAWSRSR